MPWGDVYSDTNLVRPTGATNLAEEVPISPNWASSPIISSDLGYFWWVFWQEHCFPKAEPTKLLHGKLEVKKHLAIVPQGKAWFAPPLLFVCPSTLCAAGQFLEMLWHQRDRTKLQLQAHWSLTFLSIWKGYLFKSHIWGLVWITRQVDFLFCDC